MPATFRLDVSSLKDPHGPWRRPPVIAADRCHLVLQRYWRLAYDRNRPPDSPDAMPEIGEITHIPGDRNLTPAARLARIHRIYRPSHAAIAELLSASLTQAGAH